MSTGEGNGALLRLASQRCLDVCGEVRRLVGHAMGALRAGQQRPSRAVESHAHRSRRSHSRRGARVVIRHLSFDNWKKVNTTLQENHEKSKGEKDTPNS